MNEYITQLKRFLKNQYICAEAGAFHSVLELIWFFHTRYYPIDSEAIRQKFDAASPILDTLSRKRRHQLVNVMVELCIEHEHAAFLEGLRVGAQLYTEIHIYKETE